MLKPALMLTRPLLPLQETPMSFHYQTKIYSIKYRHYLDGEQFDVAFAR